jgi:hypothetical protein
MARDPSFPMVIRNQSVTVRIFRERSSTTRSGYNYRLTWIGPNGVETKGYADPEQAMQEANHKAAQLAQGLANAPYLNRSDVLELTEARAITGEYPLIAALNEWSKARKLAGSAVIEACESWSRQRRSQIQRIKAGDVINAFIAAKEKLKKQGERTYRAKLRPVATFFPAHYLDTITTAQWVKYLEQFDDGVTRNDMRKRVITLCRWAQRHNHLAEGMRLEIEKTERAAEEPKPIGIIAPDAYRKLLEFFRAQHPEFLAALVVAGFCGVRSDEIHGKRKDKRVRRQLWEHVHLGKGYLTVTAAKENTPSNRVVKICPAAVQWLKLCSNRQGPLCAPAAMEKVRAIAIAAGFQLPINCFRHSYISYHVALHGNKLLTSNEAGNSVAEIDRRYRVPVPQPEGRKWFGIRPPAASSKRRRPPGRSE